ncbi:YceD family protein [Georgenia wangjunii]|uniref:YceD family protein n=1 Tax=Georgenia wangjunii TaxID=3117730 RepID=UPI002F26087B
MDTRSPLVVSTHELGRRPGAMRPLARTVPAPAELGTEVIAIPEGSDIELDLRLEAVMDGVLVSGPVHAQAAGQCVRCLRDLDEDLTVHLSELYLYPGGRAAAKAAGDEEAEELPELVGDRLDLEPALVDALVLALPFQPLCTPDCPGLCARCGERLADLPADHSHEDLDPRWSALGSLLAGEGDDADAVSADDDPEPAERAPEPGRAD